MDWAGAGVSACSPSALYLRLGAVHEDIEARGIVVTLALGGALVTGLVRRGPGAGVGQVPDGVSGLVPDSASV
ncbi:hypothetical protein GCM10015535_68390 [Streptomyces gelaticus]|uniref:Uncharacterized protein n=1 Tax=Streptomyces gelaticus TaxID=285446 RepID=A0ABQ2WB39_9ACTN|nr:hypothetical protein GCM10015535_68390 [Streptomyces gelaticus]